MSESLEEVSRALFATVSGYCRSCREVELFDRYAATYKHRITDETEVSTVAACQGCGWEYEVKK